MPETTLRELLERNRAHVESLPDECFAAVERTQSPAAVSVCCADSRVSQEGMWSVSDPGWLFTPSTIGNLVWDEVDGELVVAGSVQYPLCYTGTDIAIVVGHTGCGAITAALEAVEGSDIDHPQGIAKCVDLLKPVINAGLDDDRIDANGDEVVNQLVEFNVDRQVAFLQRSDAVPDEGAVFGFVYDFQGVYGSRRGMAHLVNLDGETDPEEIRRRLPDDLESHANRLLG